MGERNKTQAEQITQKKELPLSRQVMGRGKGRDFLNGGNQGITRAQNEGWKRVNNIETNKKKKCSENRKMSGRSWEK